ncbi:MAG: peptidoglycan editing factor PgeF [Gammaproteobacteria bacterium]|nr:peptidoglycan editing factor PgeF [Gammaproteobacteria bacterium]
MPAASLGSTLIEPDWPVPSRVRGLVTTRAGGFSEPPYASFNLALHVGDAAARVRENRRRLLSAAGVDKVQWLDQEHGRRVLAASSLTGASGPFTADASWTAERDLGLAVLVADCVPLLLANVDASLVAVVHCGWRGTVAGVVEATLDALPESPSRLVAWLGPGVCGDCYEVGSDVRDALGADERKEILVQQRAACGHAPKWRMDLPALVTARLRRSGVERIVPSALCTICDSRFYSYRRDGPTGRFAALIWLAREEGQARV